MVDLIDRQAAVSICDNAIDLWNGQLGVGALVAVRDAIKALPSADTDLSDFSDKLWAAAYERGKAEAVRCKDCYHYDEESEKCILNNSEFKPMDYCSYGSK